MFWLPRIIRSVKLPAPSPAHFSPNLPPALLIGFGVCLLSALAILPTDPDISAVESLLTVAQICIPAGILSVILCAVPSRSADQPPLATTEASVMREGYRCMFRQNGESTQFIVTLVSGRKLSVRVPRAASVDLLLSTVNKKRRGISNASSSLRLLTSTGKELQCGYFLADYNLHSNSILYEPSDLRGGMPTAPAADIFTAFVDAADEVAASTSSDRAALEEFFEKAKGRQWKNNDNWCTSAPLSEWYGVVTDEQSRVTNVDLHQNALVGRSFGCDVMIKYSQSDI